MKARVFHNDLVKKNGKDFEVGQKKPNKLKAKPCSLSQRPQLPWSWLGVVDKYHKEEASKDTSLEKFLDYQEELGLAGHGERIREI